jgi:gliding motility-associated-like protein
MKKLLQFKLVALLLLFAPVMHAQFQNGLWTGKQAYNWYFYSQLGLNFTTSTPTVLSDGRMTIDIVDPFKEGCGTISDRDGNLLFYSNGITVWNKNHEVMVNGEGLLGNYSSSQSGLVIPKPGNSQIYYIICVDGSGVAPEGPTGPNGGVAPTLLTYSEVDMSLDGGLGAVTSNKNIILSNETGEKISAVYHADKEQVWLVSHSASYSAPGNTFNAYLISDTGIDHTPVTSTIGEIMVVSQGQMKFSPDGRKLGLCNGGGDITYNPVLQVFNFNNETGEISNPVTLTDINSVGYSYGLEFSPNSRYLYYTESILPSQLFQFDLAAGDQASIMATKTLLSQTEDFLYYTSLQAAPDGKIYMISPDFKAVSVINYPNNGGISAGFVGDAINTGTTTITGAGLPGFIQSYFQSGILYNGQCDGEATAFSTIRIPGITSITWNFGDTASGAANTSTDFIPSHTFSTPGTYTVTATITSNGATQTATQEVTIFPLPNAVRPQVAAKCVDFSGNTVFNLTQLNEEILNGQNANTFGVTYFANQADFDANNPIATPANFITAGQSIYAQVTNTLTGCKTTIQFSLPVNPLPVAAAPAPIQKCASPSGAAIFNLKGQDAAVLNGQDAAGFTVIYYSDANAQHPIATPESFTSEGQVVYAVVSNDATGCTSGIVSFTINVTEPSLFTEPLQLTGCSPFNLNSISREVEEGLNLTFYTSEQDAENIDNAIVNSGQYSISSKQAIVYVVAQNAEGCTDIAEVTLQQGDCNTPKGISPNGDDKNDSFDLSGFNVSYLGIYNRYGQEVYSKDNYTSEWHGQSSNNNDLPTGTYYFLVQHNDGRSETGWVYVNREE